VVGLIRRDLKALRRYLAERFGKRRRPDRAHTPTFWYSCCRQSDIDQILEPGQTFDLHWEAGAPGSPDLPSRYLTLTATLIGPYRDPFTSVADGDVYTVNAQEVGADTWEAQTPVSTLVLPTDLPKGLFQLRAKLLITIDPGTNTERKRTVSESMGVIRVGRGGP
jgi:hypothetical protein